MNYCSSQILGTMYAGFLLRAGLWLDMDYDSFTCIVFNYKQCCGKASRAADYQHCPWTLCNPNKLGLN